MMVGRSPVAGEEALERLAREHGDLVYAAALRQVGGDAARAADVAQAVLMVMVVKGRAGHLPEERFMAGWLLRVTGYAVKQQARAEARRRKHESAAAMEQAVRIDDAGVWEIQTALDEGLLRLGRVDREVIVRRFLGGQDIAAVAGALGMAENSAGRRISRALEKLRKVLVKRGVTAPVSGIVAVMVAESSLRAPAMAVTGPVLPTPLARMTLQALTRAKAAAWLGAVAASLCVIGGAGFYVAGGASVAAAKLVSAAQNSPPATATAAPAKPHPLSVAIDKVDEPSSPALLQTLLAGLKTAQANFHSVHVQASSRAWILEPDGGELTPAGTTEGEIWMDTARHFRADIPREESRAFNGTTLGPPHLSSYTQTWDGLEQRTVFRPPHSRREATTSDRRLHDAPDIIGSEFSMQLCWSEEFRGDEAGNHTVIDRYPLAPDVLALMHLSARRVTLAGGVAATELTVEIPNDGIAAPKDTATRRQRFWFDPARGYGLLARQETQAVAGKVVMERTWIVDRLADAGAGTFYPVQGTMAWMMNGSLYIFSEYRATQVISNEAPKGDGYHVEFPAGIHIVDFKNGIGTQRGK